jgi:hypothetical protein
MTSFRVQEKSPSPLGKALHTERDNSGDKWYIYLFSYFNPFFQLTWHIPNTREIEFSLRIFEELVEPTLSLLENLIKSGSTYLFLWGRSLFTST